MNKRKDVLAKVTDIELPQMVYAKVVRSTVPNGIIRSIDSKEASRMPGVIRIITAEDIPGIPSLPRERPVLCPGRVRYIGDGVALVAAECRESIGRGSLRDQPQLYDSAGTACVY